MNLLNTWQFNLVGYLVSVVFFYQFYRLAVKDAKRDGAATSLLQFLGGASALLLMPFFEIKWPTEIKYWILIVGACVFYAVNDRLQTTARKNLQVSVVTMLNQLSTVFLFVIGVLFFKEAFIFNKFLGVLLILVANILLRYKKGKLEINKYIILAIIAVMSFGIAMTIDIDISTVFNLPIYIMLTLTVPAIMIMAVEKIRFADIKHEFYSKNQKYYLLTGVSWALTIFFSLRAFQLGDVTTVVPLQASNVLLNVLVSYFVFKEKNDELKKIVAALLIILGVYLTILQ